MAANELNIKVILEVIDKTEKDLADLKKRLGAVSGDLHGVGDDVKNFGEKANKGIARASSGAERLQELKGQINGVTDSLKGGASQAVSSYAGEIGALGIAIGGLLTAFVAVVGITALVEKTIGSITEYLKESRNAWNSQHQALLQIQATWEATGRAIPTQEIAAYASQLEGLSTYSDEAILSATRILGTFPNITDELIKPTMKVMVDFAAYSGQSLDAAAKTMGKASEGMVGALSGQGIALKDATMVSKDYVTILNEINNKVGGQAAAKAETWAGKIAQLTNAYNNLQEEVGHIQFEGLKVFFDPIIKRFNDMAAAMNKAFKEGEYNIFVSKLQDAAHAAEQAVMGILDVVELMAKRLRKAVEEDKLIPWFRNVSEYFRSGAVNVLRLNLALAAFYSILGGQWKEAGQYIKDAIDLSINGFGKLTSAEKKRADDHGKIVGEMGKKKVEGESPEEVQKRYAVLLELAKSTADTRRNLLDIEMAERKAKIAEAYQSEVLASVATEQLEREASQRRIQIKIDEYEETKRLREAQYEAEKAALQREAENPKKKEAAEKKLRELESKNMQEQVKDLQELTAAVDKEIQKQAEIREKYFKKINDLREQERQAQSATADALSRVSQAAASEYDQLIMKLGEANGKLAEATSMMPSFPEKALELAKQAQQAFAGLAQNVDSLQQNLRKNQQLVVDALRAVQQSGLTGAAKWRADIQNVMLTLQRARQMQTEGRVKEAEQFYRQAIQQAQGLATSAPPGMKTAAKKQAEELILQAGQALNEMGASAIEEARSINDEIAAGIKEAGELIKTEFDRQIEVARDQIAAIEKNTEALKERQAQLKQQTEETKQKAREKATKGGEEVPGEGAPTGPTAEEKEAQRRAVQESTPTQQEWVRQAEESRGKEVRKRTAEAGAAAWKEAARGAGPGAASEFYSSLGGMLESRKTLGGTTEEESGSTWLDKLQKVADRSWEAAQLSWKTANEPFQVEATVEDTQDQFVTTW